MTDDLVITVRFPLGNYNASTRPDHRGRPVTEWPPSPERLAAAGIAGTPGAGDAAPARALYRLNPPMILAPSVDPAKGRNATYGRWVPRQEAKMGGKWDGKVLKTGDNSGVFLDPDATLYYVWPGASDQVDINGLRRAFRNVAYLGRPTSIALIDVTSESFTREGRNGTLLVPDESGDHRVSVPTRSVLVARDAAYRFAVSAGRRNAPNLAVPRAWATYRVEELDPRGNNGSRRDAYALLNDLAWFPAPTTWSLTSIPMLTAAAQRSGARVVTPVVSGDQVRGILADTTPGVSIAVIENNRLCTIKPSRKVAPIALDAMRALVGRSNMWTTVTPIDPSTIDASDMPTLVHAVAHEEPLGSCTTFPRPGTDRSHATFVFESEITGPMVIGGVHLQPVIRKDPA